MERTTGRNAFLLRFWWETGGIWRGWVEHIESRESAYFRSLPDLLAFIQAKTGDLSEGSQRFPDAEVRED